MTRQTCPRCGEEFTTNYNDEYCRDCRHSRDINGDVMDYLMQSDGRRLLDGCEMLEAW